MRWRMNCGSIWTPTIKGIDEQRSLTSRAFAAIAQRSLRDAFKYIGEDYLLSGNTVKNIFVDFLKFHESMLQFKTPAFIGIGAFVNVECAQEVDVDDVRNLMRATKGVVVFDKHTDLGYVSLNDVQSESDIYVSRLRQDVSVENGFSFWCVADDLRAGGAQNAYNVLQLLLNKKVN